MVSYSSAVSPHHVDPTLSAVALPDRERFERLLRDLGATRPGDGQSDDSGAPGWYERLLAAYSEPQRRYHDVRHLSECLAAFDAIRDAAEQPHLVEWALWFHDSVYVPSPHDEERSADLLREMASDCGIDADKTERAAALILVTRHRSPATDDDERVLLDADLAILGSSEERFAEYERDVRAEYAFVPDAAFRAGRANVLRRLLARKPLFSTAHMRDRREAVARANLTRSLSRLESS